MKREVAAGHYVFAGRRNDAKLHQSQILLPLPFSRSFRANLGSFLSGASSLHFLFPSDISLIFPSFLFLFFFFFSSFSFFLFLFFFFFFLFLSFLTLLSHVV